MTARTTNPVRIGTRFRATIADANALWEVTGKSGGRAWLAQVVNEPFEIDGKLFDSDYVGTERAFTTAEIERSLRQAAVFANLSARTDDFWDRQPVGQVLHYNNGFDQFVRGVVVEKDGRKQLKPTALVGPGWQPFDLVTRRSSGDLHYGYHADKVVNGGDDAVWAPSSSCVYEADDYGYGGRSNVDPTTLPEIDLSAPEMTEAEAEAARIVKLKERMISLLQNDRSDDPTRVLRLVARMIQDEL
jgi:hypothetical protein